MRYKRIDLSKLAPVMRWADFEDRRPWFDAQNPDVTVTVMLFGKTVKDIKLEAVDRDGNALPLTDIGGAQIRPGRHDYAEAPAHLRRLHRLRITFPPQGGVTLRDGSTGQALLDLAPQVIFPAFLFDLLQELAPEFDANPLENFVETGTLFAHTALHASYWFKNVFTIELSKELHALAQKTLAHRPNTLCLHGNSGTELGPMIPKLKGASLFFLDAHWSGDASVDWESSAWAGYPVDTARIDNDALPEAERQVPLRHELDLIAQHHPAPAAILIDDWGAIGQTDNGFQGEDWRNLDAQAMLSWMDAHPRTRRHYALDARRRVWVLNAA